MFDTAPESIRVFRDRKMGSPQAARAAARKLRQFGNVSAHARGDVVTAVVIVPREFGADDHPLVDWLVGYMERL